MSKKFRARAVLAIGAATVIIFLNSASRGEPAPTAGTEIAAVAPSAPAAQPSQPVALSKLSTGKPGMNTWPHDDPGTTKVLPRIYPGAPPRIPHNAVDFNVTRADNDCAYCHVAGAEFADGHAATKIPPSHFINGFTGDTREDAVVGIRYNCRQCHVPQATGDFPEGAFAQGS